MSDEIQKASLKDIRNRVGMLVGNFVQLIWSKTQAATAELMKGKTEYIWRTVNDDRTCPICDALDGKTFKTMEEVMMEYPAHVFCRCYIEVSKK